MKKCPNCKKIKPKSEFCKDKSQASGIYSYCKPCLVARTKKYRQTKEGKRSHVISGGNWEKRNRHKKRAHLAVRRALKKGELQKKPCEICNDRKSVAHHPNYDEKLKVIWLCVKHHVEAHN